MSITQLFNPIQLGRLTLPNRIFMAPLTRLRSIEPGDVPSELMKLYYTQRASAGLIFSEATQVSFQAKGYAGAPGIHTEDQVSAWTGITRSVREQGGHMAAQLWHTGRISHSSIQPGGLAPVAPSAIAANARTSLRDGSGAVVRVPTSTPRALSKSEMKVIVSDFQKATRNSKTAGFELVEIHVAHGYLLHQFLSPEANHRTDEYGGTLENRMRFPLEVIDASISAWESQRIGVRIYPLGPLNGLDTGAEQEESALTFIKQLAKRDLAYLHVSEPDWVGGQPFRMSFRESIRDAFPGPIVAAGGYTAEKAESLVTHGLVDAVAFGRSFIANPDLPRRIALGAPLNQVRENAVQGGGAEGYTDYPALDAAS